jgi:hypothetical protein
MESQMKVDLKRIVGFLALSSAPLSALAGGGQAWTQYDKSLLNSAVEQTVRNWAAIDVDADNLISPQEMGAYLQGQSANSGTSSHQPERVSVADSVRGGRTLSSAELGMYFSHGPGKDSKSTKIFVPGTTYIVESPVESSNHQSFNKREMIKEVHEAMIEQEAKPKM